MGVASVSFANQEKGLHTHEQVAETPKAFRLADRLPSFECGKLGTITSTDCEPVNLGSEV